VGIRWDGWVLLDIEPAVGGAAVRHCPWPR
jgi:hypothetical protein